MRANIYELLEKLSWSCLEIRCDKLKFWTNKFIVKPSWSCLEVVLRYDWHMLQHAINITCLSATLLLSHYETLSHCLEVWDNLKFQRNELATKLARSYLEVRVNYQHLKVYPTRVITCNNSDNNMLIHWTAIIILQNQLDLA